MNTVRKTLKDAHGDEVVYMHTDVLDAPLDPAEKIVMMVLRRMAFASGWAWQHYREIAKQSRMSLSTVKNTDGVMDRLRRKGWIKGVSRDGKCIEVRMAPNWISKSGAPSAFDDDAEATDAVPESAENPGTEPVPAGTEPVPGVVLNRYRSGTGSVPPSENEKGRKEYRSKKMSEAPVALTGSGSENRDGAGAPLNFKEGTACGAGSPLPKAEPLLPPDIEQALREEAEAWTEQVADIINFPIRNRQIVFPLKDADGVGRRIKCRKMTGSSPWPGDCEKVLALAMDLAADDVDLHDPQALFRSYLRTRSARPPMRQRLQEHAYRTARAATAKAVHIGQECVTELADAPQIKIAALFRKPGDHEAMRENEERIGYVKTCRFDADPEIEAALRKALDRRNEYSNPAWDRCWREGSARCRAYGDFETYVELVKAANWNGQFERQRLPLPWSVDNVSEDSIISHWFCDGAGEVMGRPYGDWGFEDNYALFLHLRQESMSVDDGREFIFAKGKAWAKPRVAARSAPRPVPAPVAGEGSGGGLGLS